MYSLLRSFCSGKEMPACGFELKEIPEQMKKNIKGIKGNNACGLDWICCYSLKKIAAQPSL
jgi:hypothetical protein